MKKKFRSPVLINATEMARTHPDTFEVPSKRELRAIRAGDSVKVCNQGERFWVEVTARAGDLILGIVDSHVMFTDFKYGDLIQFSVDNIYDIA